MLTAKEKSLLAALEPRAASEGVEVVTVEIVGSRKAPTIRVYLDTAKGISFDEITAAQVWVNEIMDEIDPFPGAYTLEVSSPGIDRPLRTPEHFERFAGDEAYVVTNGPIEAVLRARSRALTPKPNACCSMSMARAATFRLPTSRRRM